MSAHGLPASTLLVAFAVTSALAWTAAGRRRGTPAVAGSLLLLQGALHLAFSATGAHGGHTVPGSDGMEDMPGMKGMVGAAMPMDHSMGSSATGHAAMDATTMGADTTGVDVMGFDAMGPGVLDAVTMGSGAGMLAVHLLAALLCGLWLAHGEAAFFTVARAALAYAFTPLRARFARVLVPDAPRPPVRRARRDAPRPHTVALAHTLSRRGPPRLSSPRATALGAHV
ncbi:hypothetical protein [Streptomyces sp. NPDC059491]|uniref:hypothetical protein n=1 Tax=Streptomyces sp. NPDC059491 TaxID=3346850 RepID=UPI0036767373